jgi:hypothetical protein
MAGPRFGQSHPQAQCAVRGCSGNREFRYCSGCSTYSCEKHYQTGILSFLRENKCPLCGSTDVVKVKKT